MEFLEPLHKAMTLEDPDKRLTSSQANQMFKDIVSSLTTEDMQERVWETNVPKRFRRKPPQSKSSLLYKISRIFHFKSATVHTL